MSNSNMNDVIRESLSALMDGEASEIELRQVVRACDDAELRGTWTRMETTRSLMRSDLSELAPAGLADGILAALDEEPAMSRTGSLPGWIQPVAGLAIAATVALVAVLGVRGLETDSQLQPAPEIASVQEPAASVGRVYTPGRLGEIGKPVGYSESPQLDSTDAGRPGELSPGLLAAQQRLQSHMFRHAEYASLNSGRGMMPFARVVRQQEN